MFIHIKTGNNFLEFTIRAKLTFSIQQQLVRFLSNHRILYLLLVSYLLAVLRTIFPVQIKQPHDTLQLSYTQTLFY